MVAVETERVLVRVRTAAAMCDCSPARMYELVAKGVVPSIRLDGGIRIPVVELKRMGLAPCGEDSDGGKASE